MPAKRELALMPLEIHLGPSVLKAGGIGGVAVLARRCVRARLHAKSGLQENTRSLWPDVLSGRDGGKEAIFSESYPMARNIEVFGPLAHRMILTGFSNRRQRRLPAAATT